MEQLLQTTKLFMSILSWVGFAVTFKRYFTGLMFIFTLSSLALATILLNFLTAFASTQPANPGGHSITGSSSLPIAAPLLPKLYKGPFELNPQGFNRKAAKVFLPLQYDSQENWPLVVLLHGFSGTAETQDAYLALSLRASMRGFILLTPEGTKMPKGTISEGKDYSDNPFWNATDFCCDLGNTGVNDVDYLTQLITETKHNYNVDPNRVYLFGHSNGGFMANRLACEIGNEFAGIANLGGGSFKDLRACRKPTPIAYLQIHARDDETIRYEGADAYAGGVETVGQWEERNGCGKSDKMLHERDFLFLLPGNDTSAQSWQGCHSGKELAFWTIRPDDKKTKGHNPHIPFFNFAFTDAVLDFLFRQSRSSQ